MQNQALSILTPWFRSVILVACLDLAARADAVPDKAVQWQRWEGALAAEKVHANPYSDVQIDVRFAGPENTSFKVTAFWDADRGFRFRAAFPSTGTWHWTTTCSDPSDAGLHGRTGEVRVETYDGDNPLYRHGDLRVSPDRRYLVHADGTPFLWMGDTGWNAIWKATLAEFQDYMDVRARQGFSVLQTVATTVKRNGNTTPVSGHAPFLEDNSPNTRYWRDLETKLACANDRGLMVLLTGLGNSPAGFGVQQRPLAFHRYVAGRLAGHMLIFSPSFDQRIDLQNEEAARAYNQLTTHLVTQHPGTHFETAKRYHDADYEDFCGLQSGHHSGRLNQAYAAAADWTLELWRRLPIKPVINIEAMYDAHGHNHAPNWREQDVRKLGWIAWLSGSRGYTYGAGDVPPKVPGGLGGVWRFNTDADTYDYWRKALTWPSATQMTHLRDFFSGIDWTRLVPAPELVLNQAADPQKRIAASRSASGDLLVAYLPDNPEIVVDLSAAPAGMTGRWYNPITGKFVAMSDALSLPAPATTFHRPVDWNDAVLLLTMSP